MEEERARSYLSAERCGVRPVPEDAGASAASGTQYEPYYLSSLVKCVCVWGGGGGVGISEVIVRHRGLL